MSNEKEIKDILAIDPGTENVNQFDGLLHKVQQGDVNASKAVYKAGEDYNPGGLEEVLIAKGFPLGKGDLSEALAEESEREEKNHEALTEIMKCSSELERFIRIKQVIIEKDVRIFDKMSRRRKKVYISRLAFYEASTGKYTTRKHKFHPGFKLRPVRLRYTEVHGEAMEALLNEWCGFL